MQRLVVAAVVSAVSVFAAPMLVEAQPEPEPELESEAEPESESESESEPDPEARLLQVEQDGDARTNYQLAVRALRRGEFEQAAVHFDAAYELSHRPEMLYNSYLAWRDARENARALASLRAYLDTESEIADRPRLEAVFANMQAEEAEAARAAAQPAEAPVELEVVTEPAPQVEASGGGGPPVGAIVVLALGGATLGVSAVLGGLAMGAASSLEAACPANRCEASQAAAIDELRTLSLVTDVLWPTGVVLATVGLVWLIVELGSDDATVALGPRSVELRGRF